MENIVINGLKLIEIDEINDEIFWCRFWRTDELRAEREDVVKLEQIVKFAINTVPVEFLTCNLGEYHDFLVKRPNWVKSVVLCLHAKSISDVEEFLTQLST